MRLGTAEGKELMRLSATVVSADMEARLALEAAVQEALEAVVIKDQEAARE
jgi:hypothetical protein